MSKMLVTYFSATGTTRRLAETMAAALGADIAEIVPAEIYTNADLKRLRQPLYAGNAGRGKPATLGFRHRCCAVRYRVCGLPNLVGYCAANRGDVSREHFVFREDHCGVCHFWRQRNGPHR